MYEYVIIYIVTICGPQLHENYTIYGYDGSIYRIVSEVIRCMYAVTRILSGYILKNLKKYPILRLNNAIEESELSFWL